MNAQDEAGHALGNVTAFTGTSAPAVSGGSGDPNVWPLFWTVRGLNYHIDTSRYRILTWRQSVPGDRDLQAGSIARIEWRVNGETLENVSNDIALHQLGSANVMQQVTVDLKNLQLETDPGRKPLVNGLEWIYRRLSHPPA